MCSSEASSGMEKDMNLFKDTGQLDLQFHVQSLQLLFFGFKRMLMSSVKRCKNHPYSRYKIPTLSIFVGDLVLVIFVSSFRIAG